MLAKKGLTFVKPMATNDRKRCALEFRHCLLLLGRAVLLWINPPHAFAPLALPLLAPSSVQPQPRFILSQFKQNQFNPCQAAQLMP